LNIDGIDHVNVYSKGKTELGKFLTNFAYSPIETEDGHFNSIEGYWYWLSSKDNKLRELSGWKAKEYGRSIKADDWLDDDIFKEKIKKAIYIKLINNPKYLKQLQELKLPLKHYYVYGDKIIEVPKAKWIIDYLESFKEMENNGI
jgi:hypothetical protein